MESLSLPIAGRAVAMVGVAAAGPYLRLHFWRGMPNESGRDCDLWIEGAAELSLNGVTTHLSPDAEASPVVLALPGRRVSSGLADATGRLHVSFVDGSSLVVPPGELESWQLWVDGDNVAGSVAGGGLWSAGDAEHRSSVQEPRPATARTTRPA